MRLLTWVSALLLGLHAARIVSCADVVRGESGGTPEEVAVTGGGEAAEERDSEAREQEPAYLDRSLFGLRLGNYTNIHDEDENVDRLGGSIPFWLKKIMELPSDEEKLTALRRVRQKRAKLVMVGSGTSVLSHKLGPAIDAYKTIIRFNRFETEGFEEYVGNRTSQWVVNNIDIRKGSTPPAMANIESIQAVIVFVPSARSRDRVKKSAKSMGKLLTQKLKVKMFGDSHTTAWKHRLGFTGRYFSTGLVTLFQNIPKSPVVFHGFDFGKGSHGHYFAVKDEEDTCHDMRGEGFLIQQLERDGVIVQLACMEAQTVAEMDKECRVSTLVPPVNKYTKGCHKGKDGRRLDIPKHERQSGTAAVLGNAGLPAPLVKDRTHIRLAGREALKRPVTALSAPNTQHPSSPPSRDDIKLAVQHKTSKHGEPDDPQLPTPNLDTAGVPNPPSPASQENTKLLERRETAKLAEKDKPQQPIPELDMTALPLQPAPASPGRIMLVGQLETSKQDETTAENTPYPPDAVTNPGTIRPTFASLFPASSQRPVNGQATSHDSKPVPKRHDSQWATAHPDMSNAPRLPSSGVQEKIKLLRQQLSSKQAELSSKQAETEQLADTVSNLIMQLEQTHRAQ